MTRPEPVPSASSESKQRLTATELRIIQGLAEGLQSKEIAVVIGRSTATVEFHIRMLFAKLSARSRPQLVARGYEFGYLR
ncbi:MAG TPA: helix-turn-helix transcriptional regulator [Candidatus Sulfotelmatobacter sp.]|nr:helix-turn-helix transcriptional regulator [Candidatus Sulfotelmatobacter sp.]